MDTVTFRTLVALQNEPADGNALLARVRERTAGQGPSLPTLYRCLRACLREQWIEGAAAQEETGRGRPPQIYRLTERGIEELTAEAQRHRQLASLVLGDAAGRRGRR